mgnify:CR=1 FL=1
MSDIHAHKILILDFGSQYTQLIARRVREIGVFSEIRAFDITEEEIREYNPNGIILAGGPESVTELDSPAPRSAYSKWACRYLVSATACKPWPSNWAEP